MNDDHDDLDRAIFALPLAAPPAGLRAAILRATVYAPVVRRTSPFSSLDASTIGVALAIGVWLIAWLVADHHAASAFTTTAYATMREIAEPTTMIWLALGGAIAIALNFEPLSRSRLRGGR